MKTPIGQTATVTARQADGYAILPRNVSADVTPTPLLTVFFEFNSATVSDAQSFDLIGAVKHLKEAPRIKVTGYTDDIGSERYNGFLAQRRASAVKRLLIEHGIASERIHAFGRGKCCYIDSNKESSGRSKNRRVTISF